MNDATYVGAGMPCGQCGNPLTPGQPHKCGRTPDQPRDDGTHGTRWLAGKLPPDKEVVLAHHYDDLLAAALPDERLREALAFYADKGNYTAQNPVGSGAHVWRDMGQRARAALAADRDTEGVWPDQSAMHGVLLDQIKELVAERNAAIAGLREADELLRRVDPFTGTFAMGADSEDLWRADVAAWRALPGCCDRPVPEP